MIRKATVVTHAGVAHIDEVVAVALLQASGIEILTVNRVMKVDPILVSSRDYIIDIGGVYDGKRMFDHHQSEPAVAGKCAAELVAEKFHPDLMGDPEFSHFIKMLSYMDNNGPVKTQETYGVGFDTFNSLMLIVRGLVRQFESDPTTIVNIVANIFTEKKEFLKEVKDASEWLNGGNTAIHNKNGFKILEIVNPFSGSVQALNRAQQDTIDNEGIHLVYSFDPRDKSGRCLFRTKKGEEAGIDLNTAKASNPTFCHKGGFLLNFRPSSGAEFLDIIDTITL